MLSSTPVIVQELPSARLRTNSLRRLELTWPESPVGSLAIRAAVVVRLHAGAGVELPEATSAVNPPYPALSEPKRTSSAETQVVKAIRLQIAR